MTKETIIAQLEALLQNEDFKETQAGVSSIRASYNEIVDEANKDEHDTAIEALFNSFNEKEAAYNAAREEESNQPEVELPEILEQQNEVADKAPATPQATTKEGVIAQFQALLQNEDFKAIQAGINSIRSSYKKIVDEAKKVVEDALKGEGKDTETEEIALPKDEHDTIFDGLFEFYNEKKAAFNAAREEERLRREEERKQREIELREKIKLQKTVIEELTQFIATNDLSQAGFQVFKGIQAKWNDIGRVNLEEAKETQSQYSHQVDIYFHNRNLAREAQAIEHDRNLAAKAEVVSKIEQLIGSENANEIAANMKKLQAEWNAIGQVAFNKKDEIYAKFKDAADQVYAKVQTFYDSRREANHQNHAIKMDVIEHVKTIVAGDYPTHEEWQAKTAEMLKIQEDWKKIGYSDDNEITWQTFRAVCDMFFDKKKDFYNNIDGLKEENKLKKLELCEKAESMQLDTDWNRTSNFFVQLQKQWKAVGPTLRSEENKLWERFRLACDTFFEAKKVFFDTMGSDQGANLLAKSELLERLKAYNVTGDNDFDALQEFSVQWNAIGFVPIKEKERLQKEYNAILDEKYTAARKLRNDAGRSTRPNNRPEGSGGGGNRNRPNFNSGGGAGNRSADALREKIERKQEEITQYENNLGFFASSKKPSPIVVDLQNKLTQLKGELKTLQDNLRVALTPPPAPAVEEVTTENSETIEVAVEDAPVAETTNDEPSAE